MGTVCLCVALQGERWERTVLLPGDRADVRERTTTRRDAQAARGCSMA